MKDPTPTLGKAAALTAGVGWGGGVNETAIVCKLCR